MNKQTGTQKVYQADPTSCLVSNASDNWGKKLTWGNKIISLYKEVRNKIRLCFFPLL